MLVKPLKIHKVLHFTHDQKRLDGQEPIFASWLRLTVSEELVIQQDLTLLLALTKVVEKLGTSFHLPCRMANLLDYFVWSILKNKPGIKKY